MTFQNASLTFRMALSDTLYTFEVDSQLKQDVYVEVWCEKEDLTGIIEPVTDYYRIPLLVNRGFGSSTALNQGATWFEKAIKKGRTCVLLYLGDHDLSGLNIIRSDIPKRLREFEVQEE